MALPKRKCQICSKAYIPVTNWQKYCSQKCYTKSAYHRYVKVKCPTCENLTVRQNNRCQSCYMKEKIIENRKNIFQRFTARINKTNYCWIWLGALNKSGHGVTNMLPPSRIASRVSWILHVGDIPVGKLVLHKCDNPPCVNPDHLYIGNHRDNILDAYNRGQRKPRGKGKKC